MGFGRAGGGPEKGRRPLQAIRQGAESFTENGNDAREKKALALLEGFQGGYEIGTERHQG